MSDEQLRAEQQARRLLWTEVGTVLARVTPGIVRVNLLGNQLDVETYQLVRIGDAVRVLRNGEGLALVMGRVGLGDFSGTLASFTPDVSCDVLLADGSSLTVPYVTTYKPVIGDLVAISWAHDGLVIGKMTALAGTGDPSVIPPAPPPPPVPTEGRLFFNADDSGSFSGSWWTPKVYFSESNEGAWFYGTKIADTLAGSTALDGCGIYLPVERGQYNNPVLCVHNNPTKPGGAPGLASDSAITAPVGASDWYPIPTPFAQYLINNRGAGIGTRGAGYYIFSGVPENNQSGRLVINYRR